MDANSYADAKGAIVGTAFVLAQNAVLSENGDISQITLRLVSKTIRALGGINIIEFRGTCNPNSRQQPADLQPCSDVGISYCNFSTPTITRVWWCEIYHKYPAQTALEQWGKIQTMTMSRAVGWSTTARIKPHRVNAGDGWIIAREVIRYGYCICRNRLRECAQHHSRSGGHYCHGPADPSYVDCNILLFQLK